MKIAATGIQGFIGTQLVSLLAPTHELIPLGFEEKPNILERSEVEKAMAQQEADIILHLAAYTNVEEAEKQKEQGHDSDVWKVNVLGTQNIADMAKKYNKRLIHISTDMVFGGIPRDWYHEKDTPAPINMYGQTKYEAEQKVLESGANATILRISYPYTWKSDRRDFVRMFIGFFKEKQAFSSVSDAFYAPTYIDDIAMTINLIVEKNLTGIIHGASGEKLSGYQIAGKIADKLNFDKSLVSPVSKDEFFKGKALRANNTALYNDTLHNLNVKMHTLDEALEEIPQELLQ